VFFFILKINGHAIFWEPPSRASLGKQENNICKVPVNDDHNQVWCGGLTVSNSNIGNNAIKENKYKYDINYMNVL